MTERKIVYGGSFDPLTNGHLNIIERVAPLCDELVVVVAVDTRKTYTFSYQERMEMIRRSTAHIPNIAIGVCIGRYLVKYAAELGARVIVRGLRNFKDLEDEQVLAEENRKIFPGIETMFIPCLPELAHVSSSMVKGHIGVDPGWLEQIARSVPKVVALKLEMKHIEKRARAHWDKLMGILGTSQESSDKIFQDLVSKYSEPHRAYHNLKHIVSMLDAFEECDSGHDLEKIVKLHCAIWYHDYIYETETKVHDVIASNEARSAYFASMYMGLLGVDPEIINRVSRLSDDGMIMGTMHKQMPEAYDQMLLSDLDLLILAQPEEEFDEYEAGIRAEYAWVPEADFRAGRKKVLQSFLDRKSIYSRLDFKERFEEKARENLKRSIAKLS